MSTLQFDQNVCTLCGVCIDTCSFGALAIQNDQVEWNSACTFCQSCISACPQGAISLSTGSDTGAGSASAASAISPADCAGVLIFAEQAAGGQLHPISLEMLGKGLELAQTVGWPVWAVLVGHGLTDSAIQLIIHGAEMVLMFGQPELQYFRPEPYTAAVCAAVAELAPAVLLFGATPVGRSLAPRVATRLHTGLTADCTGLTLRNNGELVQTRPAFGGNVMAQIVTPRHRPQIATVRHKVMASASPVATPSGRIVARQLSPDMLQSGIRVIARERLAQTSSITDADVIVAAGRGAATPRARTLVAELAELLGGVVGASRPLVESGFYSHEQQIGLSGRTVRPKLYIACGISGSVQHLAGMRGAEHIVAINTDRQAPIGDVAHVTLVGDVHDVLEQLITQLKRGKTERIFGDDITTAS